MEDGDPANRSTLRRCTALPAVAAVAAMVFTAGCGDNHRNYVADMGDAGQTPTMETTNVSTLISDSGYTRYHIESPVWRMYEDLADPYWKFPQGLDLEQYDNYMHPQARMRCDSATYWSQRRLWRLDGHVVMVNTQKDTFLTSQLYWDQVRSEVYSDSFMHIVRSNHIIEGYGFTSNQNITAYTVHRPTAIIPIERQRGAAGGNAGAADTMLRERGHGGINAAPVPASQRRMQIVNNE